MLPAEVIKDESALVEITDSKTPANEESYTLTIDRNQINITAPTETGAFYAIQSLLQMTRGGVLKQLECCTINDTPRLAYRGLHVDVSRHFRPKEFILVSISTSRH